MANRPSIRNTPKGKVWCADPQPGRARRVSPAESGWITVDGLQIRAITGLSERQIRRLDEMSAAGTGKTFRSARAAARYLERLAKKKA